VGLVVTVLAQIFGVPAAHMGPMRSCPLGPNEPSEVVRWGKSVEQLQEEASRPRCERGWRKFLCSDERGPGASGGRGRAGI